MTNTLPDLFFPNTSIQLNHINRYGFDDTEFVVSNVNGFKAGRVYVYVPYKSPHHGVPALEPMVEQISNTFVRLAAKLPQKLGDKVCDTVNSDFRVQVVNDDNAYKVAVGIVCDTINAEIYPESKTYISYEWNPNTHVNDILVVVEAIRQYTCAILKVAERNQSGKWIA